MGTARLTEQQLRAMNRVLLELYEDAAGGTPLELIVEKLALLTPSTWCSMDLIYPGTDRIDHLVGRNVEGLRNAKEGLARYGHENPSVAYLQRVGFAPAVRISDFVTFRELQQTGFYAEVLQQMTGVRDQAGIVLRLQDCFLGFSLNRETVFSDEEKLMMELLQPHFERVVYRLRQYAILPGEPLTPREREVLHWLAEGKRDGEIAVILQIAQRTISQHVRRILQKLGVETRTAAAAMAWRSRRV